MGEINKLEHNKLTINTTIHPMSMVDRIIFILFLCSPKVAQYVIYGTIVMVYFKLKSLMCKSDLLHEAL